MASSKARPVIRRLIVWVAAAVFLAMIGYGAFIQRVSVTQAAPDGTEKQETLKGYEILSKARAETLSRQDGRLVEKVAVAAASGGEGTAAGSPGTTEAGSPAEEKPESRCPT